MNLDNRVEYIATDPERQTIPVGEAHRSRAAASPSTSVAGTTPEQLAAGEHRVMDCMDCHNRPAHTFDSSPERAVDAAIALGQIPRDLPFARREAVAALQAPVRITTGGDGRHRAGDARGLSRARRRRRRRWPA